MKRESTRRVAPEKAASPVEIAAAIELLSAADFLRLGQYARRRIRLLGSKAGDRVGDDLLQTALQDLLEDTRRWDKTKVDFMGFLFGAMRSISSNWAKSYEPDEVPVLETDLLRRDGDGKIFSPFDSCPANQPTPEEQLSDRQTLSEIDNLFREDQGAQMLLTGWQEGLDPAAVRELWSLSQNDYNTIVRRIRRTIDAADLNPGRPVERSMSNKRTDTENLHALFDALTDSTIGASDEEVVEEARLIGQDPSAEAGRLKALMLTSVKSFQQRALREARQSYDAQNQQASRRSFVPGTPAERRDLLSFVLAKQPQYAELFTAQHREFTDLTDSDIESYLEDLDELGVLEKIKPDTNDGDK